MKLKVTLDIYSGRPNPTVEVEGAVADDLMARLKPAGRMSKGGGSLPPRQYLGYRGILIEEADNKRRGAPRLMRVADGRVFDRKVSHWAADPQVEDFIFGSGSPIRFPGAPPKLHKLIPELKAKLLGAGEGRRRFRLLWPVKPTCPCAPLYEPDWWNDGATRQANNNCYNYACDYRSDTFAQPGLAAGSIYTDLTGTAVRAAAVRDELINAPGANNKCPKEGHLVALVIWPGVDFHWYRRGRNGRWTHKPGSTEVTNLSNSGATIADPRTADRGPYTEFTTFMVVMHGHIKIA